MSIIFKLMCQCLQCRITKASALVTEVSTDEMLVFLFACEIRYRSKFELFACAFHGTIFATYNQNVLLDSDLLLVWEVATHVSYDARTNQCHLH